MLRVTAVKWTESRKHVISKVPAKQSTTVLESRGMHHHWGITHTHTHTVLSDTMTAARVISAQVKQAAQAGEIVIPAPQIPPTASVSGSRQEL